MYDQLNKVSLGFRLVYIGMMLIVIGILGGVLGMCLGAGIAGGGKMAAGAGIMLVVVGLMMLFVLGGSLCGLVGRFFCLAVPDRAGSAKPMIIISVVLEIASFGLSLVGGIMNFTGNAAPAVSLGLNGAQILCSLTSAVLFLLFTKTVAEFVRRSDLAESAMTVLQLWLGTIGIYAVSFAMVLIGGAAGGANGMAGMACVAMIGTIAALILAHLERFHDFPWRSTSNRNSKRPRRGNSTSRRTVVRLITGLEVGNRISPSGNRRLAGAFAGYAIGVRVSSSFTARIRIANCRRNPFRVVRLNLK